MLENIYQHIKTDVRIFQFIHACPSDGLWYWDFTAQQHPWISPGFWTTLGYGTSSHPDSWLDIVLPTDVHLFTKNILSTDTHVPVQSWTLPLHITHKNNVPLTMQLRGLPILDSVGTYTKVVGTYTISDSPWISWKAMFENENDMMLCSIDSHYSIMLFNTSFKTVIQKIYDIQITPGMNLLAVIKQDEVRAAIARSCECALTGKSLIDSQSFGAAFPRYFDIRYYPLQNNTPEIIGVGIFLTDITQRKLEEEYVKSVNKELETFANEITLDIQTPTRLMSAYTKILLEEVQPALRKENIHILDILSTQSRYLDNLVNGLLAFFRLRRQQLDVGPVNMRSLIDIVIKYQLSFYEKELANTQFNIDHIDNVPCDRNLIQHVFYQLISNALKFAKAGEQTIINIGSERQDDRVIYFIKDNGIGFEMQNGRKVFQLFKRLRRDYNGYSTGVGLAMVQRIVEKHSGQVWVHTAPRQGATFFFSIPIEGGTASIFNPSTKKISKLTHH